MLPVTLRTVLVTAAIGLIQAAASQAAAKKAPAVNETSPEACIEVDVDQARSMSYGCLSQHSHPHRNPAGAIIRIFQTLHAPGRPRKLSDSAGAARSAMRR